MRGCLENETIIEFSAGGLPKQERAAVLEHVDECPRCRQILFIAFGDTISRQTPDLVPAPMRLEDHRFLRKLGAGAMGEVYLAHDTLLDRYVAIKLLKTLDPGAKKRFLREARAIARLSHPNVVALFRVGESEGRPFLESEFVKGQPLDEFPKPVPWRSVLLIALDLSRGLAALEQRGVLHRDIKPANIIVATDGCAKLLDFGLAKLLDGPIVSSMEGAVARPQDTGPMRGHLSQTGPGALVGTPLYMAPEIWAGETATRQTDIYSLGAVLYELCTGAPPHVGAGLSDIEQRARNDRITPVAERAPDVDLRFAAIIDRCLQRDPSARFRSGEALRAALDLLNTETVTETRAVGLPYRGLEPFEADHRSVFFGRSAEISHVVERLRYEPLVLVAGISGVGKSSLCRAGVVPAICAGALGPEAPAGSWTIVKLVPGRHPMTSLAAALARSLDMDEPAVANALALQPDDLARELRRRPGNLLVFVDQLEELVALSDPAEATMVSIALSSLAASASTNIRVLGAVRGDFLVRLAALPGLEDLRGVYVLPPLADEGVRDAIVSPARSHGFGFESEPMVDSLIAAASTATGGLPLLQFALAELWSARDEARMLIPAGALERIGGVEGALAQHADRVLNRLLPDQQRAARTILGKLVTADGTRARRTELELVAQSRGATAAGPVLEALVQGRLVVASASIDDRAATFEIAHEALIVGWHRLREWLSDDAERRRVIERTERAAAEWARLSFTRDSLWGAKQIADASRVADEELSPLASRFVAMSKRELRWKRWRRVIAASLLPAIAAGAWMLTMVVQHHDIEHQIQTHYDDALGYLESGGVANDQALSLVPRSLALLDHEDTRVRGEQLWAEALDAYRTTDMHFAAATRSLETAEQIEQRAETEALLARLIFERTKLADRFHQDEIRAELIDRLSRYDRDGSRRAQFVAPPLVSIETLPEGARLLVQRYEPVDGRLVPGPALDLGPSPIARLSLNSGPGSYLLTTEAPGRIAVRYPLFLGPGESFHANIDLPLEGSIPEGYVYVAAGRFRFQQGRGVPSRHSLGNADPRRGSIGISHREE